MKCLKFKNIQTILAWKKVKKKQKGDAKLKELWLGHADRLVANGVVSSAARGRRRRKVEGKI